jgi:hypothetical protein
MKKTILATVVCLGAAIGSAQTLENLKVTLPIAAKVGNVYLPAGNYSIHELNSSVIEISSDDRKGPNTFATVNTITGSKAADHSKIVLRKEDNEYQVDQIWIEGQDLGFELTTAE